MDALREVRLKIDALDDQIIPLLAERLALSIQVIEAKQGMEKAVLDTSREETILSKLEKFQYQDGLKVIYQEIMNQSKHIQNNLKENK